MLPWEGPTSVLAETFLDDKLSKYPRGRDSMPMWPLGESRQVPAILHGPGPLRLGNEKPKVPSNCEFQLRPGALGSSYPALSFQCLSVVTCVTCGFPEPPGGRKEGTLSRGKDGTFGRFSACAPVGRVIVKDLPMPCAHTPCLQGFAHLMP